MTKAQVVGIDLGTARTTAFVAGRSGVRLINAKDGATSTPTVVAFQRNEILVGTAAERQAATNPRETMFSITRLLGRRRDAPCIASFAAAAPFAITAGDRGDARIRIGDRDRSPEELTGLVLDHIRELALNAIGDDPALAVVAVPCCFDVLQRTATKTAARLAGFRDCALINSATAAAVAHVHDGADARQSECLAVFDLGGGALDVSLVDIHDRAVTVIANSGDGDLGGIDFDLRVVQRLVDRFAERDRVDLRWDGSAMQRLFEAARAARHELSQRAHADVDIPLLAVRKGQPIHLLQRITRQELEADSRDELGRLAAPCAAAFAQAGIGTDRIDELLLLGGLSRMPAVAQAAERLFRKRPRRGLDAELLVARGAALYGAMLMGLRDDVSVFDVASRSLGVHVKSGRVSPVVMRNSRLPCRIEQAFEPEEGEDGFVELEVFQGESDDPHHNVHIGRFTLLEQLPFGARVDVRFALDSDGLLQVTAREAKSGAAAEIEALPAGGLDESAILKIMAQRDQPPEAIIHVPSLPPDDEPKPISLLDPEKVIGRLLDGGRPIGASSAPPPESLSGSEWQGLQEEQADDD
jgi:molecular chaperone DnaK